MRLPHNLFRFSFDWNDERCYIDADDLLADLPATARDRILAATPRDTVIGWGQLEWAQEASVLEDASRLLDEDDPATTPSTR